MSTAHDLREFSVPWQTPEDLEKIATAYRDSVASGTGSDNPNTLEYQWHDKKHRHVFEMYDLLMQAALRIRTAEAGQNNAYNERNRCVAVMAKMALRLEYPAGLRATAIEGWDESWHGCVWIDFPGGQASWHYHASDAYLFDGLPPYEKEWDGHSTPEKYEMMERYRTKATP